MSQKLNHHQERAVRSVGHSTILACPGSGKTRVLSARAARLLTENTTGRLCAVTFTRDAAASLKLRILEACGKEVANRLAVGTFHSIALNQLRRAGMVTNRLLGDGERLALLRRCYLQHKCDLPFEKIVSAIDGAKASVSPKLFADSAIEDVYAAYQDALAAEDSMDFSDILLLATRGMAKKTIHPLSVRWLLVDEAQDMDAVQCEWVMLHGKSGVEVTIVGDDDQSLYAFRHAMGYSGMMLVSETLSSQEITLPINYRCASNIIAHASALISLNQNRANKAIHAARGNTGIIGLHRASDRNHEAEIICNAIEMSGNPTGWAVLARSNTLLESIEAKLAKSQIPYSISGGKSVWDGVVGSALVGLIRNIERDDLTGLANALSVCKIQPHLLNHSADSKKNCTQLLDYILSQTSENDERTRKIIVGLKKGRIDWLGQAKNGQVTLAIYAAAGWLRDSIERKLPKKTPLNSNGKMIGDLAVALSKLNGSVAQRLNVIMRKFGDKTSGGVSLLTMHSSKGLEFDNVWILGAEDNTIPHPDSTEEDERRLFYVAMTRA
ncbi:MAG: hypothetical protein COZ77_00210, partial [Gallionellales bacterium CG_4_8_14_3_um_filter_54_18]